jgi:hypothetical protein
MKPMKFICGSCNEVIQELVTSRFSGGAIPHNKCGSITTFQPTDWPHTPKAIDVRPYTPPLTEADKTAAFYWKAVEHLQSRRYSQEEILAILAKYDGEDVLTSPEFGNPKTPVDTTADSSIEKLDAQKDNEGETAAPASSASETPAPNARSTKTDTKTAKGGK